MRMMRFSAAYLLSLSEKRGLKISFNPDVTILHGPNGFGKSAVMKSLYETLGATPHKIDRSWRSARVITLLEFSIDDQEFTALRVGGRYSIFDGGRNLLLETTSITSELSPFLAILLNFGLMLEDRNRISVIPPPAYMFAPYYIDQDKSWVTPWQPFDKMYLPNSKRRLSEYHTGLRSNAYYLALAARDRALFALQDLHHGREALDRALAQIRELIPEVLLEYDLSQFESEVEELVSESRELSKGQIEYRERLTGLESEKSLWLNQQALLKEAMAEVRDSVAIAARAPVIVDCPTCGQHYENSLSDQFGIVENFDDLYEAYQTGLDKLAKVNEAIASQRRAIGRLDLRINEIGRILGVSHDDTTLKDVISARGRAETGQALKSKIEVFDSHIGEAASHLRSAEKMMENSIDPERSEAILRHFENRFLSFSEQLDVRIDLSSRSSITQPQIARGSEGPRALASYYYSVLNTAREFGVSTFCPIVIDAPNQQGQDSEHLPELLRFLIDQRPIDCQLILACEEPIPTDDPSVRHVSIGQQRDQVLSSLEYEAISDYLRPFLGQLL